jgi:hypothetical protein
LTYPQPPEQHIADWTELLMVRKLLAGILGGLAFFAWSSIAHVVTGLGETGIQEIPNVSYWTFYGFPGDYTLAYICIIAMGFVVAGLVAAAMVKPGKGMPVAKAAGA